MSDMTVVSDTSAGENLLYTTSMVSKMLGVHERTLRNYCALMQKHNYEFTKNTMGHRIYYKNDIEMIKNIIDLKNSSTLTLNQVVETILESRIDDYEKVEKKKPTSKSDDSKLLEELSLFKSEQMEFNKLLIEQLQKQESYIRNSIEERDKKLMIAMKESMETRRQLAAAVEAEREKENTSKPWWKFWK